MESEEIEKTLVLEKISPTAEISEEMDQSMEEYKGVIHDKLVNILPPMRGFQHHGTFIFVISKIPFMRKKSAKDESLLLARGYNVFYKEC